MNRHYFQGYQRVFTNDINNIEARLQEYDEDLYIMWNPKDGTWLVMDGFTEMAIMKIPQIGFETLDSRVYDRIRSIHVITGYSATREVAAADERRRVEEERILADIAQDFAAESKEAFINAYDYNRTSGVNKYVNGGLDANTRRTA